MKKLTPRQLKRKMNRRLTSKGFQERIEIQETVDSIVKNGILKDLEKTS